MGLPNVAAPFLFPAQLRFGKCKSDRSEARNCHSAFSPFSPAPAGAVSAGASVACFSTKRSMERAWPTSGRTLSAKARMREGIRCALRTMDFRRLATMCERNRFLYAAMLGGKLVRELTPRFFQSFSSPSVDSLCFRSLERVGWRRSVDPGLCEREVGWCAEAERCASRGSGTEVLVFRADLAAGAIRHLQVEVSASLDGLHDRIPAHVFFAFRLPLKLSRGLCGFFTGGTSCQVPS